MQLRPIIYTLGLLNCGLAVGMLAPALVDVVDGNEDAKVFFGASIVTVFFGGLMVLGGYDPKPARLGLREGFLLTSLTWIVVCAFASIPFLGLGLGPADAYFEAMSGLTTTGATVLVGLDNLPRGVLLWRAILNGIGGLGIIVVAILILPFLRIGGMQLFQTESSDRSEKIRPRASELVIAITSVYCLLVLACGLTYGLLGMSAFDAICHALATIATGGFSTHDASFGFFQSPAIEVAATVFMLLGALPLVIFIKMLGSEDFSFWRDDQVRGFLTFVIVVSLLLAIWVSLVSGRPFGEALRATAFAVTSIVTTTGFATEDYQLWGPFAVGVFFLLTFVGGCSGSTAGGIKIYRFQMAGILTRRHLLHLLNPSRVVPLSYNKRRVPDDVPFSIIAFLVTYMVTVGIFSVLLTMFGLDIVTAASAAATAVSNVGPGLGDIVGPAGNFSTLPASAKWLLSLAMLLGRLELFTLFVLLMPDFWRY